MVGDTRAAVVPAAVVLAEGDTQAAVVPAAADTQAGVVLAAAGILAAVVPVEADTLAAVVPVEADTLAAGVLVEADTLAAGVVLAAGAATWRSEVPGLSFTRPVRFLKVKWPGPCPRAGMPIPAGVVNSPTPVR